MKAQLTAFLFTTTLSTFAFADPPAEAPTPSKNQKIETNLSLYAGAGYLAAAGGGNGTALSTGVRLGVGRHFAVGFDLGYGLMATSGGSSPGGFQDRWWFMPTMAAVFPTRIGGRPVTFDLGAGLGLGTASGYTSFADYTSHPFTAQWEFQLEPTVRAHAIAAMKVTPKMEIFVRAEAAALVLPRGSNATVTDSTWMLLSMGTRFDLL